MDGTTNVKEVILFAAIKGKCRLLGYKNVEIIKNEMPTWVHDEVSTHVQYRIRVSPPIRTYPHHKARKEKIDPPRIPLRDRFPKMMPNMLFSNFVDTKHFQAVTMYPQQGETL